MILSTALLLRHSLKLDREAECIETSVNLALYDGCRTIDLQQDGNSLSTQQMTEAVIDRMENNVS